MSYSYWNKKIDCEFCGETFEAKRRDARFCSTKCRTANNRREGKRAKAAECIESGWSAEIKQLYSNIIEIHPKANDMILDMVSSSNTKHVENAIVLTATILTAVQYQLGNKLAHKDQQIERLEAETAILAQVRDLVNHTSR